MSISVHMLGLQGIVVKCRAAIFFRTVDWLRILKAMLHEEIFLATCNATNVALQVARKNSRVTPHFATAIELYHAMLKQTILPVSSLIQREAGRAKTKLFVLLGLKMTAVLLRSIVALRVARKAERPSTFRNVARQVACV